MDIGRYLDNIDKKFTRKDKTKMKQYDYLIVGSGLYGAVFAQQATAKGKKVLVIDKRPNIAGNVYTEDIEKIHVHKYGAHIFHTNNKKVWNYITKFAEFNRFTNSPVANYKGELYSLPFNMYTFYFNALYQGIPVGGYTKMIANMLGDVAVRLNTDYFEHKEELDELAEKVIYTGPIDAYYDYKLGELEYRSVRFETEVLDQPNFQGNAAVNYTDAETPWTRIIEHKWFEFGKDEEGNDLPKTVISREYSSEWKLGDEPYYPVNDEKNGKLYEEYKKLAEKEENIIFGGRLGEYKYYDMDAVIAAALDMCEKEL